ncbi:MAG: hypothetical protein ABJD68_15850 [Nakamurella sp.]
MPGQHPLFLGPECLELAAADHDAALQPGEGEGVGLVIIKFS